MTLKTLFSAFLTGLLFACEAAVAVPVTNPEKPLITVLIDVSATAPVIRESDFRRQMGLKLKGIVESTNGYPTVRLRPVGMLLGAGNTSLEKEYEITHYLPHRTVAMGMPAYLERLASQSEYQDNSALTQSLVEYMNSYGCREGDHYLLLSDGLDYLPGQSNAYQWMAQGGDLPPPPKDLFSGGCRLSIWGVGRGWLSKSERYLTAPEIGHLIQAWQRWWQAGGGISTHLTQMTRF